MKISFENCPICNKSLFYYSEINLDFYCACSKFRFVIGSREYFYYSLEFTDLRLHLYAKNLYIAYRDFDGEIKHSFIKENHKEIFESLARDIKYPLSLSKLKEKVKLYMLLS